MAAVSARAKFRLCPLDSPDCRPWWWQLRALVRVVSELQQAKLQRTWSRMQERRERQRRETEQAVPFDASQVRRAARESVR